MFWWSTPATNTNLLEHQVCTFTYPRQQIQKTKMSPVDSISPTSPMDISPTTPSFMDRKRLDLPATPTLPPTVHMPRLTTSFSTPEQGPDNLRQMSVQYQLPTPSPLSLRQTSPTAGQQRCSVPWINPGKGVGPRRDILEHTSATHSSAATPAENPRTLADELQQLVSLDKIRPIPSLRRQNVNEWLDEMVSDRQSLIVEQVAKLPIRTQGRPLIAALQTSLETQAASTVKPVVSPSSRLPPRSSITKHRQWRRRKCFPVEVKLYILRPETPQHRQLRLVVECLHNQLVPLVSVCTGESHPEFPRNLLEYHLLTHDQLDSLVRWYHQTIDAGAERWMYPCSIGWGKVWCGSIPSTGRRHFPPLETKRRRWGRFIGLKDCESPLQASEERQESLVDRMERDWRAALTKAEEEAKMREKIWGRQFG